MKYVDKVVLKRKSSDTIKPKKKEYKSKSLPFKNINKQAIKIPKNWIHGGF